MGTKVALMLAIAVAATGAILWLSDSPWLTALGLLVCLVVTVLWDWLWDAVWRTLSPRQPPPRTADDKV